MPYAAAVTRPARGADRDRGPTGRPTFAAPDLVTASPLAALLTAAGAGGSQPLPELGFHQGVVTEWEPTTNTNVIAVLGTLLSDLPVLSAGAIMLGVGDVVGLLRVRTQYFILGRISTVEQALTIRTARLDATSFTVNSTVEYTDPSGTPGPTLTDVYIGSSRRCLVFISASLGSTDMGFLAAHFEVSGASSILPPSGPGAQDYGLMIGAVSAGVDDPTMPNMNASRMFLLTAADGLNQGFNTFSMKYMSVNSAGGLPINNDGFIGKRVITVMPL